MSKKTTYLLGILFTIIIGTLLYCYFCDDCHCFPGEKEEVVVEEETNSVVEPEVVATTKNAFAITDADGDFNSKINDNFNFKTSSFSTLEPLSTNVESEVVKLKEYLLANPSKTVDITGHYRSDETNNSAFPNLGLARANSVKNYFVSQGISSKQINTKALLNDAFVPGDDNTLYGPIELGILTGDSADDALAAACEDIRKNPLILYFKTAEAEINLTAEQRQKIADISRCIDKLGVKAQVVGHTDSEGRNITNMRLGQGRADFAKDYLVRNGILADNIEAKSKGETEPIADNNTEEGRTKNRRTVITIN